MSQPPNLLQGPEPVETAELHFKIFCKLKIFETKTKYEGGHCSLIAVSQYYGLIFVGNINGFSVIKTKSLSPAVDLENFPKKDVILNVKPTHLSVDFSQKILAVICTSNPGSVLFFYNIQSFGKKDITPLKVMPLGKLVQNMAAEVIDVAWQPNADGSLMICMSDGSVLALSQGAKDAQVFTIPATAQAMCLCWSPKGKQIVIGSAVGTLSQYKPDLKVVKTLPPPPLFNGAVMVVSVLWISSYQFAVAYNDKDNPESVPVITIVNAGKNEPVNVINYDDITYSSTLFRNHQIYMTHQSPWNLIFVSSANSMEVAVLHSKDSSSWEQLLLGDASRAELPLDADRQETFPLGWAFDFTSQDSIPWGEGILPPMPRLLLLSDEGLLCIFNVVNAAENAPSLCSPPKETLDDSLFVVSTGKPVTPSVSESPKPVQTNKISFGAPPTFGNSKAPISFGASTGFGGFGVAKTQTTAPQNVSVTNQQQELLQPQVQIQMQQPSHVLVTSAHPTSSVPSMKPPPQFGTGVPFSFGGSSTSTSGLKLSASGNTTTKVDPSQTITFTLTPSPASSDLLGKNVLQPSTGKQQETTNEDTNTKQTLTSEEKKKLDETVERSGKTEDVPAQGDSTETPELAAIDDSVYLNAIQEEIDHFNSELQQLSAKVSHLDVMVGSEEDKSAMKKIIDGLYDFWKELKETTEGQSGEIHATAMDLMEAFAWLEDAKSRNLQRKNPSYIELKKSEELDPLSARHMNLISYLKYYIENQLKQLTTYLEKEWMDHQENYRNEVKSRMAVPPLEEVYKTMHYQLKILHKQKMLVEELKGKIALKKRRSKPQGFLTSTANPNPVQNNGNRASELSKLAENLLQLKITKEENSPHAGAWETMKSQLNAISQRSKKLTREKQTVLRDALSECDMVKIRPVKTSLESSTFLRSLALEKAAQKALKGKTEEKEKVKTSLLKTEVAKTETSKSEIRAAQEPEKPKSELTKSAAVEVPKSISITIEKPSIPITVQTLTNAEEKSPLASLSGIVSSIGKKTETKAQTTFTFGTQSIQKPVKEAVVFGSTKPEQKKEEPKPSQIFTLGLSKPGESVFDKKEHIVFEGKPSFVFPTSTVAVSTKQDSTKSIAAPNVTITPVTTTTTAASSFPFVFNAASTNISSTGLPKVNLFFSGKDQSSGIATSTTTGNLFSVSVSSSHSTTQTPLFGSATPIFGAKSTATTFTTSTPFQFGGSKTTSDTPAQPSGFTFTQPAENKSANVTVATPVKPTSEIGDVDVVKVEEPEKKPETPSMKSKDSVKTTVATIAFVSPPALAKTALETTPTSSVPPNFTIVSTPETSAVSTNVFSKSVTTNTAETSTTVPASVSTTTPTTVTTTASTTTTATAVTTTTATATTTTTFSFSTALSTASVDQSTATTTATTPAASTTASLFGTSATTTTTTTFSDFGQPASTTPTTNIFGSPTPTTPIFGGSTPTKPIFGQAATPSTTSNIIFGGSTPTTNTFAQATTTSPTAFGQKPDSVSQTANLFGQLLSDGNRSVFGASSPAPTTTASLFGSKNLFGGGTSTTTSSLFGTTSSSIFSQSAPIFGQATTASSIFGQTQSSTSNSFFGQNICSPFGGGTSVTSNQSTFDSGGYNKPIFGQTSFGQTTSNTSIFGGSSSSIFGGTSSTTASNVFQTPTTSTAFGSTSPGPFSGGASSFGETSFGSTNSTFQKPTGGFGSPPVFGGAPAFGGSPTFGGSPSFSSMSTFGSMSQSTFGQTTGSTTFESLANQNTVGFGNLAQQSQTQSFGRGFGGGSSFENKPAFGGNSFSNWRSK